MTFQQITGPILKLPRTVQTNRSKSHLIGMFTDAVYKVNFNPVFPIYTHPRRNVRNWEGTLDSFPGICTSSFSLLRDTSLHYLLPPQYICFKKTETPCEEVAMENLVQVKNSHCGKVACNLSADMQQPPCSAHNSCSPH